MLATHGPQYLDACPDCGTRDIPPTRTQRVPSGVQCHYACTCGARWVTCWWEGED